MPDPRHCYTIETLDELSIETAAHYAVLGDPVTHSLSPAMQAAAFRSTGLNARYIRLHVSATQLPDAVNKLKALGFAGWNCTMPHKTAMLSLVDEIAPTAAQAQAVNTVVHRDGRLIGHSTDGEGFQRALRDEFQAELSDLRILILGLGGVGRTLARLCAQENCPRLVLVNRTVASAETLAVQISTTYPSDRLLVLPWDENRIAQALTEVDLLVQATSVGLDKNDPSVLPARCLNSGLHVYDTIYRDTALLTTARALGAKTAHGASMLLYQGAAAFTLWTGKPAPINEMKQALLQSL
jgi:shikimate dehydrogenase